MGGVAELPNAREWEGEAKQLYFKAALALFR
jgi:hypothetical protein